MPPGVESFYSLGPLTRRRLGFAAHHTGLHYNSVVNPQGFEYGASIVNSAQGRFTVPIARTFALEAWREALDLAFRALLKRFATVTYLDPDIWVYQTLDLVRQALKRAPLALTPHLTRPLVGPANPNDHTILTSGSFNLGFMAVRNEPQIEALLDWWAEKCRFDCRVDFANGLFTDQKWMDLAPGLVSDLAILRDPGLNLAYWNLEGRDVAGPQGGRIPPAELTAHTWLDDLAETLWRYQMAQLGLGFNPELLALSERYSAGRSRSELRAAGTRTGQRTVSNADLREHGRYPFQDRQL